MKELIKEYDSCKVEKELSELKKWEDDVRKKLYKETGFIMEGGLAFAQQLEELEKKLRKTLIKNLEIREGIKTLEELKLYHRPQKHLFWTLSVSDLIVFRTLMEIEKKNFNLEHIKEIDKKRDYEEFISIAQKHRSRGKAKEYLKKACCKGYGDYYKQCYEYKRKSELEKLGNYFSRIHTITPNISKNDALNIFR